MLLYTHLAIAKLLISKGIINISDDPNSPTELSRYYLASILPDIRYLIRVDRKITHPKLIDLKEELRLVDDQPFIWGYRVHLIVDKLSGKLKLKQRLYQRFWFLPNRLRLKISGPVMRLLFEMYYMEKYPPEFTFHFEENEFTRRVGIKNEDAAIFTTLARELIKFPDWDTISRMLGSTNNPGTYQKLERYYNGVRQLGRSIIFKKLLMFRMKEIALFFEDAIIDFIRKGYL